MGSHGECLYTLGRAEAVDIGVEELFGEGRVDTVDVDTDTGTAGAEME